MKQTHSGIWVPNHIKPARKFVNVVFYHSRKNGHISVGAPESVPLPKVLKDAGYEKVICRNAAEVDKWSQKMRDQEKRNEDMTEEQRDAFEAPLRKMLRDELIRGMMNARNPINQEFCRQALVKIDAEIEAAKKVKRVSFMHAEGYEDGQ